MFGQLSHELEVNVPASEAWEIYGTLGISKLLKAMEAGVGLFSRKHLCQVTNLSMLTWFTVHKEKFTKLDNEKCMKEPEVIKVGYLDLGFTLFCVCVKIIENDNVSCIIKSTIEYDVKEEVVANTLYVNTDIVAKIAEVAKNYLIKNKATKNVA
ncbi:hypothetical protein ACB092_12G112600 [Castanea dentata]